MHTFDNLPTEKRERIVNAAMSVFAAHGYHKTSVMDIARQAGISKAMIFSYFGSKIGCYRFLCEEVMRNALAEFNKYKEEILALDDYFDRIILSVRIKVDIFKSCPSLLAFATSIFSERDEEALPVVNDLMKEGLIFRRMFLSSGVDATKFKNPADAETINRIAVWLSSGCADEWSRGEVNNVEQSLSDFVDCMFLLKKHFYK